jgi:hypothetical protein
VKTEYFLHGKRITELKRGNDEKLHFFYDAASRPAMVRLQYKDNGDTVAKYFTYMTNLQGDIVRATSFTFRLD